MTIYLSNYARFKDKHEMDNAANQHITSNVSFNNNVTENQGSWSLSVKTF